MCRLTIKQAQKKKRKKRKDFCKKCSAESTIFALVSLVLSNYLTNKVYENYSVLPHINLGNCAKCPVTWNAELPTFEHWL